MADYGEMFYGTLPQDTQDMDAVLRGVGRSLREIGRSTQYLPYDVLGAPVDIAAMAMRPFGYEAEQPVGGSDWLIEMSRRMGIADRPTGSGLETATRFATGVPSPVAVPRALAGIGRFVDMLKETPPTGAISPEIAARVLPDTKVVDEAGKPLVVYHGTPDAFESSIRGESYFSPDPEIAGIYTSPTASSIATFAKRGDAPAVYPSYLEIKKPFDTRDPKIRKEFMEEYYGKYGNMTPLSDSGLPDWTEARDLREWIEETGKNYDGLILDEGGLPMPDGTVRSRGISYVPFESSQIKSALSDPQMAGLLDQPAQSVEKIYHGTSPKAAQQIEQSGFDITKSADGTVWFTSNPEIGEVAATGKGAVVERLADLNDLKLGGWDEADRFGTDELIQQGYDGLRLVGDGEVTYQIFNPEKLKKAIK